MKINHYTIISVILAIGGVTGYLGWRNGASIPDVAPQLSGSIHHDDPLIEDLLRTDYPLADPSIIDELQEQDTSALIGVEGVLGGTIGFYDESQIWDMGDGQYLAYREDGHIMGYALLYKTDNHRSLLHNYTY